MDTDYPAAHSMDTEWFAIDRDGRVALFSSGEPGHVPREAADDPDAGYDLVEHLGRASGQGSPEEEPWDLFEPESLASLGLFVFDYPDNYGLAQPYTRTAEPAHPLHVDQLPPQIRERGRRVRFPVSFAEVTLVQPCEHVECVFWGDEPGYLCSDGRTLRAFPDREAEFRALWEEYRSHLPEERTRDLRFEGDEPS